MWFKPWGSKDATKGFSKYPYVSGQCVQCTLLSWLMRVIYSHLSLQLYLSSKLCHGKSRRRAPRYAHFGPYKFLQKQLKSSVYCNIYSIFCTRSNSSQRGERKPTKLIWWELTFNHTMLKIKYKRNWNLQVWDLGRWIWILKWQKRADNLYKKSLL